MANKQLELGDSIFGNDCEEEDDYIYRGRKQSDRSTFLEFFLTETA